MTKATVFAQALGIAVVTAAQRDGSAPPEVCARIGVDPALLGRPDARVPHEEVCRRATSMVRVPPPWFASHLAGRRLS